MSVSYVSFLLFAFVASITPGPTNLLVLANGARHGVAASLPAVLGASAAAASVLLLVVVGLGELLARVPLLLQGLGIAGLLWLLWLAWRLFNAAPQALGAQDTGERFGAGAAAALQLINPKTWSMALSVLGVFAADDVGRAGWLALGFFLIACPCLVAWAVLGAGSRRLLPSERSQRRFNRLMALALLASTLGAVLL